MYDTEHVIRCVTVDGVAGAADTFDPGGGLPHGEIGVESDHLRPWCHHVPRVLLGELEHTLDHADVVALETAGALTLPHQHDDLFGLVHPLGLPGGADAEQSQQTVRRSV